MKEFRLNNKSVRVDDEGFVSLTDMWKASGGSSKHQASNFIQNENTQKFIDALNLKHGYPCFRIEKGRYGGTWGHKMLAYKFASWIDPVFEVGVYTILDLFFSGNLIENRTQEMMKLLEEEERSESKGSFHGTGLNKRKQEKDEISKRRSDLLKAIQPDLWLH